MKLFDLQSLGVAVLAPVPAGLPLPSLPIVSSETITSRSFASRGGYDVDVDMELVAYGATNVAASVGGGFVVT